MSSALDTLLEAARYIELQELRQQHLIQESVLQSTPALNVIGHPSILTTSSPPTPSSVLIGGGAISTIGGLPSHPTATINNIRYNNTLNNQIVTSSPQISPLVQSTATTNHIIRIDSRQLNEEPFMNGHSVAPPLVVISTQQQNNNSTPPSHHHHTIHQQQLHGTNGNISNSINSHPVNNSQLAHQNNNHNSLSPPSQQSSASSSSFELSRSRSSSVSSAANLSQTPTILANHLIAATSSGGGGLPLTNGVALYHHTIQQNGDDSNQSSLNLSSVSSGYLSGGSSANSSIGSGGNGGGSGLVGIGNCNGTTSSSNSVSLNLSVNNNGNNNSINHTSSSCSSAVIANGIIPTNCILTGTEQISITAQSIASGGRRRTTSTNSNGGTQRSPCMFRAGTREVHNKLEKNRRAHLKECFEQLKKQLPLMSEEKKSSNLSILGAAIRYVQTLKRKERELEHEMERLAKEKIAAQQKILLLKRELSAQWDHIDFPSITLENDVESIREKEPVSDLSVPTGRGVQRYSSSSSLSSAATSSSPCATGGGVGIGTAAIVGGGGALMKMISTSSPVTTTISPVISAAIPINNGGSPKSPRTISSSSSPISSANLTLPLALTTSASKQHQHQHQQITTTTPLYHHLSQQAVSVAATTTITHQQQQQLHHHHHHHINEMTMQSLKNTNGKFVATTNCSTTNNGSGSPNTMAINLTTSSECGGIITSPTHHLIVAASNSSMPLNLNASSSSISSTTSNGGSGSPPIHQLSAGQNLQIISTNSSSLKAEMNHGKNGIRVSEIGRQEPIPGSLLIKKELGSGGQMEMVKMDTSEPPTKVIKLINGSTIALASVDKEKLLGSGQTLTLQQVVGGGGLVVSPIPLLTQGLRVIGQSSNGLATIELNSASMMTAGQQGQIVSRGGHQLSGIQVSSGGQVTSSSSSSTNGAQLHKLLVSGTSATSVSTSSPSVAVTTTMTPDLARLPGGAELNILPANTNGSTTYYRSQKLAIVNNGISLKGETNNTSSSSSRAVHVVTPIQSNSTPLSGLTPIVVPQGQAGTNLAQLIAASQSQLTGKVIPPLTVNGQNLNTIMTSVNPYIMKPMVVVAAAAPSSSPSSITTSSAMSTNLSSAVSSASAPMRNQSISVTVSTTSSSSSTITNTATNNNSASSLNSV